MSRRLGVALAAVAVLLGAGVLLTLLSRNRVDAAKMYSLNNLRELNNYATGYMPPEKEGVLKPVTRTAIPPGTIVRPNLKPEERLSWVVDALPYFNQQRQQLEGLYAQFDQTQSWRFEANHLAGATVLKGLVPSAIEYKPVAGPALTYYLGIAGRGADAAVLDLGPPVPTRAGCWRYNGETPLLAVKDGLSVTLLFGETATDLGPWVRGGPSTLRGVDDSASAKPIVGPAGQFGGVHPTASAFSFADGSAKFMSFTTDPRILVAMSTIAGGSDDPNLID
jgi:hypothetical protein